MQLRKIGFFILTSLWLFCDKYANASSHEKIANYTCQSGEIIDFLNVCDSRPNCADQSDENLCESEAILYHYTHEFKKPGKTYPKFYDEHFVPKECLQFEPENDEYVRNDCDSYQTYKKLTLNGIFLKNKREFSVSLKSLAMLDMLREDNKTYRERFPGILNFENIEIVPSSGPRVNVFYDTKLFKYLVVKTRNDTSISAKRLESFAFMEDIESPVFDWTTSKVYYILVKKDLNGGLGIVDFQRRIIVCEEDDLRNCNDLVNDQNHKPVFLAIAPQQKVLFSIQKTWNDTFQLYKYQLANISQSSSILQDSEYLNSPKWLTIDPVQERLYWMDLSDNKTSIYSTKFDGGNIQKVDITQTIPPETSSFAVFYNLLYWPDEKQKAIFKCHVNYCDQVTVFRNYETKNKFQIRYLFIDHRPPSTKPLL